MRAYNDPGAIACNIIHPNLLQFPKSSSNLGFSHELSDFNKELFFNEQILEASTPSISSTNKMKTYDIGNKRESRLEQRKRLGLDQVRFTAQRNSIRMSMKLDLNATATAVKAQNSSNTSSANPSNKNSNSSSSSVLDQVNTLLFFDTNDYGSSNSSQISPIPIKSTLLSDLFPLITEPVKAETNSKVNTVKDVKKEPETREKINDTVTATLTDNDTKSTVSSVSSSSKPSVPSTTATNPKTEVKTNGINIDFQPTRVEDFKPTMETKKTTAVVQEETIQFYPTVPKEKSVFNIDIIETLAYAEKKAAITKYELLGAINISRQVNTPSSTAEEKLPQNLLLKSKDLKSSLKKITVGTNNNNNNNNNIITNEELTTEENISVCKLHLDLPPSMNSLSLQYSCKESYRPLIVKVKHSIKYSPSTEATTGNSLSISTQVAFNHLIGATLRRVKVQSSISFILQVLSKHFSGMDLEEVTKKLIIRPTEVSSNYQSSNKIITWSFGDVDVKQVKIAAFDVILTLPVEFIITNEIESELKGTFIPTVIKASYDAQLLSWQEFTLEGNNSTVTPLEVNQVKRTTNMEFRFL